MRRLRHRRGLQAKEDAHLHGWEVRLPGPTRSCLPPCKDQGLKENVVGSHLIPSDASSPLPPSYKAHSASWRCFTLPPAPRRSAPTPR